MTVFSISAIKTKETLKAKSKTSLRLKLKYIAKTTMETAAMPPALTASRTEMRPMLIVEEAVPPVLPVMMGSRTAMKKESIVGATVCLARELYRNQA